MTPREIQIAINHYLGLSPPLEVDGIIGERTRQAIEAFQSSGIGPDGRPLVVDGIVGPLTEWALTTVYQPAKSAPRVRRGKPRSQFGAEVVTLLEREIVQGAREIGANNLGRFVARYSRNHYGAWCAWLVSYVTHEAAATLGIDPPFPYTGGARHIRRELAARELTFDADDDEPQCGDLVFWYRGDLHGWQGHVGVVTDYADGVLWTIEGNRGGYPAPVRQFSYVLEREKKLLGFARLQ